MIFTKLAIPDVILIEPNVIEDGRGFFLNLIMKKILTKQLVKKQNLFKIIIQDQQKEFFVGCITNQHHLSKQN